jgi:hypothetical protein
MEDRVIIHGASARPAKPIGLTTSNAFFHGPANPA